MQHMIAYYGTVGTASTLLQITPVQDPTVTINGYLSYVPTGFNKVALAAACDSAGDILEIQLQAPSLRTLWYPDVSPVCPTLTFDNPDLYMDLMDNPLELKTAEGLSMWASSSSTSVGIYGVVIYSDDKVTPANGRIFTLKATASATLATGTFVNAALTLEQTLPVGDYDVVGMRLEGTDLVAGRLVFIGKSAVSRPGVLAQSAINKSGNKRFRQGRVGVLGTFNYITPPTIDFLGTTGGTAQTVYLDLIQRSSSAAT